jgi:hypothetical protein
MIREHLLLRFGGINEKDVNTINIVYDFNKNTWLCKGNYTILLLRCIGN